MNYKKCSICGAASAGDKCAEHSAKWQRRFFYPCRYCGQHVKSYRAKRCRRPACISRAMSEAAAIRFPAIRVRKPHAKFTATYRGRILNLTSTGWARVLGTSPALITYHLSKAKPIADIISRFLKKGGKKNAR